MFICIKITISLLQLNARGLMKYKTLLIFCVTFITVLLTFLLHSLVLALWSDPPGLQTSKEALHVNQKHLNKGFL